MEYVAKYYVVKYYVANKKQIVSVTIGQMTKEHGNIIEKT
jgi:hypothetical protein